MSHVILISTIKLLITAVAMARPLAKIFMMFEYACQYLKIHDILRGSELWGVLHVSSQLDFLSFISCQLKSTG